MGELRHSVIRVVRSSTNEVDRRGRPRREQELPCRLHIGGQTYAGQVVDLSEAGAGVRATADVRPGVRGTLAIDAIGFPLALVVKRNQDAVVGVEFALDDATAARLRQTLTRLVSLSAA